MNNLTKKHSHHVGKLGEEVACLFLMKHHFDIVDKNYLKKWGEIDIIAKKSGVLRFVEVKTVSRENIRNVSQETFDSDRPEENVHSWKIKRLYRTIQSYLIEKNISDETKWQIDIVAVFLDMENKEAKIRFTENVVL
ncbi:MAG: YraN family protein [Patescibacteria group bacterium]|nr:YraN family protein [Patescibacteria group bacterium]